MGKKILIVEDSQSIRMMISLTLTKAGYTVTEAVDGEEALEKFSAEFNAIITDLNMPKINGIELIQQIRGGTVKAFIPIIMLTTESEQQLQDEGKKAGATAWIVKPFTPEDLCETIRKIIG